MKRKQTTLTLALGAAIATSFAVAPASADSVFSAQALNGGYMVADNHKAKEGKCGGDKAKEGNCGNKEMGKGKEGKCGEGKCGNKPKAKEGNCGAGAKAQEGKCGGKK
ncbi:MAG: hypothetical protein HY850_12860 [Betaproteobacteria bacterium]|nr:hypothetical protein [Betaproteobacteria bacterium]